MPWFPCTACAQSIVDSGIVKLVSHKDMLILGNGEVFKFDKSYEILKEGGVDLVMFNGKIGDCKAMYMGKVWEP